MKESEFENIPSSLSLSLTIVGYNTYEKPVLSGSQNPLLPKPDDDDYDNDVEALYSEAVATPASSHVSKQNTIHCKHSNVHKNM